ncbi:dihydropteroate synthase [Flavisolibacter tropicus]|uniref:dihydropteroate synthase n=1 Tax=Flavisolibacter tropicus TaxID=1492898 RepID=A0A172TQK6_9BACT|nr:dihydropteroate synthase [Flavisolibacter tropicus]ANE49355.1 dihydropteroate synthase [Flavisolibacter tropicus]
MLSINCKGRLLNFETPVVMGIINTTPDSFYSNSRKNHLDAILETAGQMLQDGATILDIGGQSTRPGSERVAATEELNRVLPAIEAIHASFPDAVLSIDTFYASVAEAAIRAGAHIINDVSAGTIDNNLLPTVARLQVPYVLMHMQGDPQTMQANPTYNNVVLDVFDALNRQLKELIRMGINDIIVDPGFGFGKTIAHNFQLLHELSYFQNLQKPLLVGLSRKGTIYKTLKITAEEALNGTIVLNTISLLNGAHILRVHDVKEAMQAIKLVTTYQKEKGVAI